MARAVATPFGQAINVLPLIDGLAHPPTLIAWGGRDPIMPVAQGRRAATVIAGAHLRIFAECYHDPQLEMPERFNEALLTFLAHPVLTPAGDPSRAMHTAPSS